MKLSQLIVIETASARSFWKDVVRSDQVVQLPGFRDSDERREWFQMGDNFHRCKRARVFWVHTDRDCRGHTKLLFKWLRQIGLVLVDNTQNHPHTITKLASKPDRRIFRVMGGQFLHVHVEELATVDIVRNYYRSDRKFLAVSLGALRGEASRYHRLVTEITDAKVLFFVITDAVTELLVDSVFHWLGWGRAVVLCSVGEHWPIFDRTLTSFEKPSINFIYVPKLALVAHSGINDPNLFSKLLLKMMLSGKQQELFDSYIQFG